MNTGSQNIRGNKEADIAAKEAMRLRRAKKRNGKWREKDSGHIAEKHEVSRARATIKLASEQKTLERWEKFWSREKTSRELYAICPKPTKQMLKIHKDLCKAASALVVQMKIEKIGLNKFLHSRKVPGFDFPECPCRRGVESAKQVLVECRAYPKKKNRTWEVVKEGSSGCVRSMVSSKPNQNKKIGPGHL